jgi:hypothetical protein
MVMAVGDDTDFHVFPPPGLLQSARPSLETARIVNANGIAAAATALPTEVGNPTAPFRGNRLRMPLPA